MSSAPRSPRSARSSLVAATDGNHGRAVAHMARLLGYDSQILVPAGTAAARIDGIASEGASVTVVDGTYDDAVRASAERAGERTLVVSDTSWAGYTEVPANVIDGYTTIFAELDDQLTPPPDLVVVPMGVGALAAAAVEHYAASATIVAVEPLSAACGLRSAEAGRPVFVAGPHDSIMAGLNCGTVSMIAWPALSSGVDAFVAVGDGAAEQAMRDLAAVGVVAGETGAASLAGLRAARRSAGDPDRRRARARCSAPRVPPTRTHTNGSSAARRSAQERDRGGRTIRRRAPRPEQPACAYRECRGAVTPVGVGGGTRGADRSPRPGG